MCIKQFNVTGLNTARTAYEVEEFLAGLPDVDDVDADAINDTIEIEYDETTVDEEYVLDSIEHAGCRPSARGGVMHGIKRRLG